MMVVDEVMNIMNNDDWIQSAIHDDSIVADLLIRFQFSWSPPNQLKWGTTRSRKHQILRWKKEKGESNRASPTTPLNTWSGGTSSSGGGGASDDSCHLEIARSNSVRSKAACISETGSKLSRKKQKFVDLQEEESFLIKEKKDLKRPPVQSEGRKEVLIDVSGRDVLACPSSPPALKRVAPNGEPLPDLNLLPDLNMPWEESSSEDLYGMS